MTDERYAAKEWLNRNYTLWYEIQQLKARREILLDDINGGVAKYYSKDTESDPNKAQARMYDMRLSYSELCETIDKRLAVLNREDRDTLKVIEQLSNADERAVLTAKYINYLPWSAIQNATHWGRATLFRIRDKALDEVYEVLYGNRNGNAPEWLGVE